MGMSRTRLTILRAWNGTWVAEISTTLSKAVRKKMICELIELLVIDAVHMQIDRRELTGWFEDAIEKFNVTD